MRAIDLHTHPVLFQSGYSRPEVDAFVARKNVKTARAKAKARGKAAHAAKH